MKIHFAEHDTVLDETIGDLDARTSQTDSGEGVTGLKDRPAEKPNQEQSDPNVLMPDVTAFGTDASVEGFEEVVLDAPAQVRKFAQFGRQDSQVCGEDPIDLRLTSVVALERNFYDAGDVEWIFQFGPHHAANSPYLVFDVAKIVDTLGDHDSRYLGIRFRVDVRKEIPGPSDRFQTSVLGFDDQVHFPEGNRVSKVDPVGHEAVVEKVRGESIAHRVHRPFHQTATGRKLRSAFAHRFDVDAAGEFVSDTDQNAGEQAAESAPIRDAGTAGSAGAEMERQPFLRASSGVDGRGGAAKRVQVPTFERPAKSRVGDDGLSFAGKDFPESCEAQALVQSQKAPATPRHLVDEYLEDRCSRNDHVRSSAVLLAVGPKGDLEKTLGEMFKSLQRIVVPSRSLLLAYFNIFSKIFDFFRSEAGGGFLLGLGQRRGEVLFRL
mgnify:FL=1